MARYRHTFWEVNYMLDTPQFIQTDEQLTAVIHLTVPRTEISDVMGRLLLK